MFSKKSKKSIALSIITVFTVQTILQTNNIFALDKSIAKDLIINNDLESTTDNKESVNNNSGSTTDNKEPVNNDSGSTTDNKEPVNNDSESTTDNKEPVNNDSESTTDNKEVTNNDLESTTNNEDPTNNNTFEFDDKSTDSLKNKNYELDEEVDIQDLGFKKILNINIHGDNPKYYNYPITRRQLENLDTINSRGNNFSDFKGIEYCKNLRILDLEGSSIGDIKSLVVLKNSLTELNLCGTDIADITPLAELNNLTRLDLRLNKISNIEPLKNLKNLKELYLEDQSIEGEDVMSIGHEAKVKNIVKYILPVNIIDTNEYYYNANDNTVNFRNIGNSDTNVSYSFNNSININGINTTFSGEVNTHVIYDEIINFKDINLKSVIAKRIGKPDTQPITKSQVANILALDAQGRNIQFLDGIENLKRLDTLNLNNNNIENLKPLENLDMLTTLRLSTNKFNNDQLKYLENLNILKNLDISRNKLNNNNLQSLSKLKNLRMLEIGVNNISNLDFISSLENLNDFRAMKNNITDISPLQGLNNLKNVVLNANNIKDISSLKNFISNNAKVDININNQKIINTKEVTTNKKTADVENIIKDMYGKVNPIENNNVYTYDENKGVVTFKNIAMGSNNKSYTFNKEIHVSNVNINYSGSVSNTVTRLEDTSISVTVPTKMAFQVVSNTNSDVPELVSGNYKIINNSEYKDINVYLESFTKESGDFNVIQGSPVNGDGKVEMNLKLSANNTNDIQIYDNFNKSTPLGKLKYKRDNSTENTMNLKFTGGDKIETGKDENIAGKTFKNQFKFVFKFENVN